MSFTSISLTHSLFIPVMPKTCAAPLTLRPSSTLLHITGLPLKSLFCLFFPSSFHFPQEGVPTSTRLKFWESRPTSRDHTYFCQRVYPWASTCPLNSHFKWTVETRWFFLTLPHTISINSPEQEMTEQRTEGKHLLGRSTVRSPLLRTKTSLFASPLRDSHHHQISLF